MLTERQMKQPSFDNMTGTDLKEWRSRNSYTQEQLRISLGIKSRQTVINWEKSEDKLPRMLQLSLLALELFPDKVYRDGGIRSARSEYKFSRNRGNSLYLDLNS
jgi:DNA-binding XRE family transcriptional regulator